MVSVVAKVMVGHHDSTDEYFNMILISLMIQTSSCGLQLIDCSLVNKYISLSTLEEWFC